MISKSTIAAMVLIGVGFASPAFAQVPQGSYYDYAPGYYYGYAGPSASPYEQPVPYDWAPYGYGGWPPGSAASINYNIHTPPNH